MHGVNLITVNGRTPRIHSSAFIAPGCQIIGDVEVGPDSSIWYNCVLRADVNVIRIGARTNIQDGTVIHCDGPEVGQGPAEGYPTLIGDGVLIGHMAMLHGCVLHDRAFVGLASVVMNACVMESDSMLAAGALLTPGKTIGARELWGGRPAKFMRLLSGKEIASSQDGVDLYVERARAHVSAITILEADEST